MRTLFVFRGNMQKRILEKAGKPGPTDFLYGYNQFSLEKAFIIAPRGNRKTILEKALSLYEMPFAKKTKLGMPLEIFPLFRKEIQKASVLFCINDAIGLSVAFYKMLGLIDAKVIFLAQSLPERLKYFEKNRLLIWYLSKLLNSVDKVVTLSEHAQNPLKRSFKVPAEKIAPFYFGVDTVFWQRSSQPKQEYICSVGNDINRDFGTLVSALPMDLSLKLVTNISVDSHDKKVEVLNNISDEDLKQLYQKSLFAVIPSIHLEYESSGLSSILQLMACGTPAIMSYCPTIAELFEDGKDVLFYRAEDPKSLRDKIETLRASSDLRNKLAQSAYEKVNSKFNVRSMASQLERLVRSLP